MMNSILTGNRILSSLFGEGKKRREKIFHLKIESMIEKTQSFSLIYFAYTERTFSLQSDDLPNYFL